MELGPDEEFWMKRLQPPPGCVTVSALSTNLFGCVSGSRLKKILDYCKELGIELGPIVRTETYFTKPRVYKKRYRWLTQDEIKKIMELHYSRLNDWD